MAFFSVIIPLYNKENFVEKTIQSVLGQTFQDFEILIIEDCSIDNSFEVVSNIISSKIKIIRHEENKGLSASRNTGIKNAEANYIAFLDADDLWKPNYLEKLFSMIQNFPEAKLFATNYEEIHSNKRGVLPTTNLKQFKKDGIVSDFFESNLSQAIYCCSSVCMEKSVFNEIGEYNEEITFGEDIDFNIRANFKYKLAYSKEPLVEYLLFTENQITNTNLANKTIPDFSIYESWTIKNPSLKKYLDFNRYMIARYYKMEGDLENFNKIRKEINTNSLISGLNYKQRFLLNSPLFLLKFIKKIKLSLLQKGIRITTYD
jgi:glycosyltransferase involved in cell wall biosynthesis